MPKRRRFFAALLCAALVFAVCPVLFSGCDAPEQNRSEETMEEQTYVDLPTYFDFTLGKTEYRLTCPFDGAWRVQAKRSGEVLPGACETLKTDLGEEVNEDAQELIIETLENTTTITCEDSVAILTAEPFSLAFSYDGEDRTTLDSLSLTGFSAPLDELTPIFGTGERFNGVNQRGKLIDLYSVDHWCQTEGNSYVPIPLLITTSGYSYFINRYERMTLDLDSGGTGTLSAEVLEEGVLDLYVFLTDDPTEVLYNYSYLSGFSPVPADFVYGIHVSRHGGTHEFSTPEGILAMAQAMDENDLPWDTVILEGWEPYDYGTLTDLQKVAAYLAAKDKRFLLYQSCGRYLVFKNPDAAEPDFAEKTAIHNEYSVKDAVTGEVMLPDINLENPADAPNARIYRWLDITNPDARDQWFEDIWGSFATRYGCSGAKMDFCEQFPGNRPLTFADGRSISGTHHWYPVYLNAMTYRNFAEKRGVDGAMLFARGGAIGAQRYPILWTGDQLREWRFLPAMLSGALSAGLSGVPFIAFDLGGYLPSQKPENNPDTDIFLRGAEMACFSVCMQTHGKVPRPYDYEEDVLSVYRLYSELHEALVPYLAEQGKVSAASGVPLMRHLFLADPYDATTWNIDDEYFLGEALLVAPMLSDGEGRDIYLPAGCDYVGLFDKQVYTGGSWLYDYPAPLNSIPVFVRADHASDALSGCLSDAAEIIRALSGK